MTHQTMEPMGTGIAGMERLEAEASDSHRFKAEGTGRRCTHTESKLIPHPILQDHASLSGPAVLDICAGRGLA